VGQGRELIPYISPTAEEDPPHFSNQTSSNRQPLKALFTIMVRFLTSGVPHVPPRLCMII
jgi:hypothetical protein